MMMMIIIRIMIVIKKLNVLMIMVMVMRMKRVMERGMRMLRRTDNHTPFIPLLWRRYGRTAKARAIVSVRSGSWIITPPTAGWLEKIK